MADPPDSPTIRWLLGSLREDKIVREYGLTKDAVDAELRALSPVREELLQEVSNGEIAFDRIVQDLSIADVCDSKGAELAARFRHMLVIGIGGSTLGFRAIHSVLAQPGSHADGRVIRVIDNADPLIARDVEAELDLKNTAVIYISKSGATPEPAANAIYFYDRVMEAGGGQDNFFAIAGEKPNGMHSVADRYLAGWLPVPDDLPGRYSVLSAVGLLPAAFCRYEVRKLVLGAKWLSERLRSTPIEVCPATVVAAINRLLERRGITQRVFMPYANRLLSWARWLVQLWAESLGKISSQGRRGTTPIIALGATDQHSQLQLYLHGPKDKFVCMVGVNDYKALSKPLDRPFPGENEYDYFQGQRMDRLLSTEMVSTEASLTRECVPSMRIMIPEISPHWLGALFYYFQFLVTLLGRADSINPFDQPAVETGKNYTYGLMGREGFERYADEFRKWEDLPGNWVIE